MSASLLPVPPGAVRRFVDVPRGPLAVLEVVVDDPAVVLVPGFTGSKEDFRHLLAPLAADGRRVVAMDQRGQHESAGPDEPDAYAVSHLAADLLHLLDALGGRPVHLVGHSFGGLVCRHAVLEQPDAVVSLTLMCSGPEALTGPRVELLPLLRPVLEEGGMPALVEALAAIEADDPRAQSMPPDVQAFLRERMLASVPGALLGMAEGLTGEPDRVDELRATGVPLLVLHGAADDAWSPAVQAEMAERLGARYVVVPDAMHSPAVENPAPTARAMSAFFADVESAR
ncbi:MAG TPA: alpha/beta hydrolase [Mycobacteriales bacterium]|nr:alpha/beta hydrolase [Mycobacteriales bacterium]